MRSTSVCAREGEILEDRASDLDRVRVVVGEVIRHPRDAGVHVSAAEVLGAHFFAGRGLHQRWAGEKNGALLLDDHRLVAHRRHVGAAGGARPHHHGDLRDPSRRHTGLVVEDASEMLPVGKDLGLHRQKRATRVDEVDAGEAVLERDLLGAQVLLHRHRVVGAALDGGIVGDDQGLAAGDAADSRDHSSGWRFAVVEVVGGEGRELEKGRGGIEQRIDTLASEHLAAPLVPVAVLLGPSESRSRDALAEVFRDRAVVREILLEVYR